MAEEQARNADEVENEGSYLHRANAQQARVHRLERFRSNGDSSVMGQVVHKVCCVCGCDLAHKMRFKDGKGKYWCSRCNDADHERTRPATCTDCGVEMPRDQMKDIRGEHFCPVCYDKRETEPLHLRNPSLRIAKEEQKSSGQMVAIIFAIVAVLIALIVIVSIMA